MKIKKFEVTGLHGNENTFVLDFNDDLNILSGRNGAGKTTILKLMWYLISGNFDKAVAEIKFTTAHLYTDHYILNVKIDFENKEKPIHSELKLLNVKFLNGIANDEKLSKLLKDNNNIDISWFLTQYVDSSFFMPTFRMIEGGFTTEKYDIKHDVIKEFYLDINKDNDYNDIEIALNKLSHNLSKKNHKFITSISAKDIDTFLVKKYAEIMKKVNLNQAENLQLLSHKIKFIFGTDDQKKIETMHNLDLKIKNLESEAELLNKPLDKIKSAVTDFMPTFNMEFDEKIYFSKVPEFDTHEENIYPFEGEQYLFEGEQYLFEEDPYPFEEDPYPFEAEQYLFEEDTNPFDELDDKSNYLTINNLSAGEKQLLTFVAYNIFHNDTIFFIDEPELSLHVDWQSKLFSLLKEQNPSNQFIISTHSPFIYSLFPDKELIINTDKGCAEF